MDKNATYIGMDLGSYKTSVASSTGIRDVVLSAVGRPKDHVARTMLGREVVFGKDVIEHRLALTVIRPFEKGVLKYGKQTGLNAKKIEEHKTAARELVQHAVSLTRPPKGLPIYGVIGAPSRASIENKNVILEAAVGAFDAVLIVSEPFTIAYGMNRLCDTLVVDIGAGTIDICPIYGTYPAEEEQITLPIGGDYIDEIFTKHMREKYPQAQLSSNMIREIKEKYGFVHDVNETAQVMLPVNGKPMPFDVSKPLKAACSEFVPPIVEGLRGLIGRFDPEFQQRLLQNIVLGGGGSQLKGLDRVIEEALKEYGNAKVKKVYDACFAGAMGALKLAMAMPRQSWDEMAESQIVEDVEVVEAA
jgi:rod shape-determining protein MreB